MGTHKYDIVIRQEKADSPTYATAYSLKGLWYLRKYIPNAHKLNKYELTETPDIFLMGAKELKIGGQSPNTRAVMWINPPLH